MKKLDIALNALEKVCLPLDDCPSELLRYLVDNYSIAFHTTPDFIFGPAIAAVAQAAGSRFRWSNGKYYNYPQFYIMLLGTASSAKSDSMAQPFKPIFEINERERNLYNSRGYTKEQKEETPFAGICTNGKFSLAGFQNDLSFTTDGMTIAIDEMLTFFGSINSLNQREPSDDSSFFTTAFTDPEKGYSIRYKGKGCSRFIEKPLTRILGTFQDGLVKKYFKDSPLFDLGFFARFMIFKFDSENVKPRNESLKIDDIQNRWKIVIENIYNSKEKIDVVLSAGAERIRLEYLAENDMLRDNGKLTNYEYILLGKLEVIIIRLAMTMAILRVFERGEYIENCRIIVNEDEMLFARKCMNYFLITGKYVYELANGVEKKDTELSKTDLIVGMLKCRNDYGWSDKQIMSLFGITHSNLCNYKTRYNVK